MTDEMTHTGHEQGNRVVGEETTGAENKINLINIASSSDQPTVDKPNEQAQQVLPAVIALQSLLTQFSHPQVRGHFASGRFGWRINPLWLPRLDELKCVIFPRWLGGGLYVAAERSVSASKQLSLLLQKNSAKFVLPTEEASESLTYREWFEVLELIAADPYWDEIPPEERCTHILSISPHSKADTVTNIHRHEDSNSPTQHTKLETSSTPRMGKQQHVQHKPIKIEEVIISDSEDSSILTSDDQSSNNELREARYRHHKREVVKPPVFVLDGKESLAEYLAVYEVYFKKRFNGSEREMTQELANFIEGSLLDVYNIKGGRKLKYSIMKKELIEWYKRQKIGGRSYWKKELDKAEPTNEECYELYGMRLVELAKLAYPDSPTESAKHLRAVFLRSIDSEISQRISDAELAFRVNPKSKAKYMPFSSIVQMAKELQGTVQKKSQTIMWTTSYAKTSPKTTQQNSSDTTIRSRSLVRNQPGNNNLRSQSNTRGITCNFCKKRGHRRSDCWRLKKSCLICGGNHAMEDCGRYDPSHARQRNRNATPGVQPPIQPPLVQPSPPSAQMLNRRALSK